LKDGKTTAFVYVLHLLTHTLCAHSYTCSNIKGNLTQNCQPQVAFENEIKSRTLSPKTYLISLLYLPIGS